MNATKTAFAQLEAAATAKKLSASAVENIRTWLSQPYLCEYAPQVEEHLAAEKWTVLEDAFWTTIPFGTGGRRGRMYPIGCNAINDRTIGESAQGLADYVKEQVALAKPVARGLSCAIAYDTRHRSRHFAELCSEIMVAAGFTVYFLDGYRSTPELSFTVRHKQCDCGIIITASHNPPSDNAVKVYGPSGGQYVPPHDAGSIQKMQQVTWIKRTPFAEAMAAGKIVYCQQEVDAAFVKAVLAQSIPGPRNLKILYSPLHGVGASAVCPVLREAGFREVEVFGPHAEPNGDFPNVPNHVANPENAAVFDAMIERAKQSGAELILATDPDCDRLGCAVRKSLENDAAWTTLTGNQLGSLLVDFLLGTRQASISEVSPRPLGEGPGVRASAGNSPRPLGEGPGVRAYVVKTLVTTELFRHVADHYGVTTAGNLHVGFKWIGAEMDARGPKDFVLGAEESYGFLAGDHVRDKDAAVASLLTAELAAKLKAEGKTLAGRLDELMRQFGCFTEGQINVQMPGKKGMDDMRALMAKLRADPPEQLGGMKVVQVRDYLNGTVKMALGVGGRGPGVGGQGSGVGGQGPGATPGAMPTLAWACEPLDAPAGDMVILDLELDGNYVAVRPSGTEPKVKIYLFAFDPPAAVTDLESTKAAQAARREAVGADFRTFSGT